MQYDYLIVGAGSAGATLAGRLSESATVQVALVEAGPDHRSAEAPDAMRSPNPSRIINAPDFEMFRWDTLQARRTTSQAPRLHKLAEPAAHHDNRFHSRRLIGH